MELHIETIAIGDEILAGKISDSNSTFVASTLFKKGLRLTGQTVVADDPAKIRRALESVSTRADVAICFGGLGPTSDDKTAEVVAEMLGTKLVTHTPSLERLMAFLAARKRKITSANLKQVVYPESTTPIANLLGLAAGFSVRRGKCQLFFLPGVPFEMRAMFLESALDPILARVPEAERWLSVSWKCMGIAESDLQILMNPVEAELPKPAWLGYRTRFPENHLTLYFKWDLGESAFHSFQDRIRGLLGAYSYTEEDRELPELVGAALLKRGWRIALAESCTGGLVVQRLTQVPGASEWVWGGLTTYQIAAKKALLGLTLDRPEQAVSADCSRRLAEGVKRLSGAEVSAAITGYLGPSGGSEENPVGTLYLHVIIKDRRFERKLYAPHRDRETAQIGASTHLLNLIWMNLK